MDNSINICNDEYFTIQQGIGDNNLDFSVNMDVSNKNDMFNSVNMDIVNKQHSIDIFNSPKKRNSMDLELSYIDEQYFENSNTFEVANQEREEPCK